MDGTGSINVRHGGSRGRAPRVVDAAPSGGGPGASFAKTTLFLWRRWKRCTPRAKDGGSRTTCITLRCMGPSLGKPPVQKTSRPCGRAGRTNPFVRPRARRWFRRSARAVAPGAGLSGLRLEMLLVAVIDQRVQACHRARNDIAAAPAIAAVRSAKGNVCLAPETDRARPAMSRSGIDFGLVEKLHLLPSGQ